MQRNEHTHLHALTLLLPALTSVKLQRLIARTGSSAAAWDANEATLRASGFTERERTLFYDHREKTHIETSWNALQHSDVTFLPADDPRFPKEFSHLPDPPIALYVRGPLTALAHPAPRLAVVGSRTPSPYGIHATLQLTKDLASRGLTIVSGLAYGIDSLAHRACVDVGGRTIAVLGGGSDDRTLYPPVHATLAHRIIRQKGLLITEYAPGTRPTKYTFPARNRLIAALARAVLIIEAGEKSGTLITATFAADLGRDVLAVPGEIFSSVSLGTNKLIRDGATPVLSADDVFAVLAPDMLPPISSNVEHANPH